MFRTVLSRTSISDQWRFDRLMGRMAVAVVSIRVAIDGGCRFLFVGFTLVATVLFTMCLDWYYAQTLNQSPWCTPNLTIIPLVTWSIHVSMCNGDMIQRHTIHTNSSICIHDIQMCSGHYTNNVDTTVENAYIQSNQPESVRQWRKTGVFIETASETPYCMMRHVFSQPWHSCKLISKCLHNSSYWWVNDIFTQWRLSCWSWPNWV